MSLDNQVLWHDVWSLGASTGKLAGEAGSDSFLIQKTDLTKMVAESIQHVFSENDLSVASTCGYTGM